MKRFSNAMPSLVFCMLGYWDNFDKLKEIITKSGFIFDDEYSILENDDRMVTSFTASVDRVNYSVTDEEWTDIYQHKAVGYFCAPPAKNEDELRNIAGKALILVKFLLKDLGVTALKCESAGIAHGRERWIELSDKYVADKENALDYLYLAYVRRPLESEYGLYSCGMHLLGFPDTLYYGGDEEMDKSVANMDKIAKLIISCDGDYDKVEDEIDELDIEANETKLFPAFYEEDSFQYNPYGLVYVNTDEDYEDDDDDDFDDDDDDDDDDE